MGDCLQTGCLQNILRARVRPGPVGFPLRPQTGHSPRGTNVKTLVLNLPNNVKELRHFLGMVQYYRDMWARCSEMLAPLTDLVGEWGENKTRMNKTKK